MLAEEDNTLSAKLALVVGFELATEGETGVMTAVEPPTDAAAAAAARPDGPASLGDEASS